MSQIVGDGKAYNCIDAGYSIGVGGDAVKMIRNEQSIDASATDSSTRSSSENISP